MMAAASALRGLKQRDTNKRPRVTTSAGEQPPARKAGDARGDLSDEIAAVTAKNTQLQQSVASLKRKFSLREEETHQLLLGLGALNAVAAELAELQREHQARAALIQESLAQISSCSAQVDALKQGRGLTAQQLQNFRRECAQQMNRLMARLAELANSADHEPLVQDDELDENRRQMQRLEQDVCVYSARVVADDAESCHGLADSTTTARINVALAQLDELHAEMFQLNQSVGQEHQSFRRHLEDLVAQQMTQIREVQDNETERIHEEMDEIRSGMCGILKDLHRLKERTKYLVPSMARVGSRTSRSNANGPPPLQASAFGVNYGDHKNERRPTAIPHSAGYSITMATRQCQDELPHFEHGYDDDCYCPGVLPSQTQGQCVHADRLRSPSRSSNSSAPHSDDENWRMISPPATGQRAAPPCESPHYSSRSSSLSGRLSVYGEEHVVPNDEPSAERFERQLLEQHRLFWIGEGAG